MLRGESVLRLMDTHGLTFEDIVLFIERDGEVLDAIGFIEACEANPNYSRERAIKLMLRYPCKVAIRV